MQMEIRSVADLYDHLKELQKYKKLLFRGESQVFSVKGRPQTKTNMLPTLFRPIQSDKELCTKSFIYYSLVDYKKMAIEFYKEVKNDPEIKANPQILADSGINQDLGIDKEFMALCQHYGIPTPLLDLSEKAEVALYFACQDDKTEPGILHVIQRQPLVKLSTNYLSYSTTKVLDDNSSFGFDDTLGLMKELGKYAQENHRQWQAMKKNIVNELKSYFLTVKEDTEGTPIFRQMESLVNLFVNTPEKGSDFLTIKNEILKQVSAPESQDNDIQCHYKSFSDNIREQNRNEFANKKLEDQKGDLIKNDVNAYLFFIYLANRISGPLGVFWPSDFKLYFKCEQDFARIANQKGSFTLILASSDPRQHSLRLSDQGVEPRKSQKDHLQVLSSMPKSTDFKVYNKKEILNELERRGINEKYVYPDKNKKLQQIADRVHTQYLNALLNDECKKAIIKRILKQIIVLLRRRRYQLI